MRTRKSATFRRLTDARRWARDTKSDLQNRRRFRNDEAEKHTLAEPLDRYAIDVLPHLKPGKGRVHDLQWWKAELVITCSFSYSGLDLLLAETSSFRSACCDPTAEKQRGYPDPQNQL